MTTENELKPCPFCGATAILQGKRTFYVECPRCFSTSDKYARPKFAIEAWNRRIDENENNNNND